MIITIALALIMLVTPGMVEVNGAGQVLRTTTVEVERQTVDYQSILDEFEDGELETKGTLTTFTGYKTINVDEIGGYDYVNETNIDDLSGCRVYYKFSYDKETNIVTISAELEDEFGEIYIDTITGAAFINEYGEIDAVMNVDGEGILLSEMRNAELIANCGWFRNLIKRVAKVVVVAATVAVVVAATAAVVVATAGAAAPALVAAGVGITTSTAVGAAAGVAAGGLFMATVGMSAIQAGTAVSEEIAEGAAQVVDKVSGKILSIVIEGTEYATKAVTSALIYELEKNSYHLAALSKDGVVYISITPIDRGLATWATRSDIPVYTYYSANAYQVAKDAGDGMSPVYEPAHRYKDGVLQRGIFFDHWHTHYHKGHCLFGSPYINL